MNPSSSKIISSLTEHGCGITDFFLSASEVNKISEEIKILSDRNLFKSAGVGKDQEYKTDLEIRGDLIYWFTPENLSHAQEIIWAKLVELKEALNTALLLGVWDFEGHYAIYEGGAHYTRHRDAFRADDSRVVSVVIYFNQDWQPAHGGQLRIFSPSALGPLDVEPKAGTLVCFLSHEIEHEVLPSFSKRLSFAGWFKRRQLPLR